MDELRARPIVTAIVSAWYAEQYLAGRLDNLISQSPRPEIVVVCRQGSVEQDIALQFQEYIRLVPVQDMGIYSAWNEGIKYSTGEYITNANCDDRLYPGALEILARVLDSDPTIGIAYGDDDIVREVGGLPVNRHEWIEGGLEELRLGCFIGPMPMWRRSLHSEIGYFDPSLKVAGDYEFWLRTVATTAYRVSHIPRAIGAYLSRKDSLEHKLPLFTVWETARVRARYHDGNSGYLTPGYPPKGENYEGRNSEMSTAREFIEVAERG